MNEFLIIYFYFFIFFISVGIVANVSAFDNKCCSSPAADANVVQKTKDNKLITQQK